MVCRQSSKAFLGTSSTVWLTKAVDTAVSYPVPVVLATSPGLRRPPVLLVCHKVIRRGEITACSESQELIITLRILLEPEETTCTARMP